MYARIFLQLEHLQNLFFIERLLQKALGTNSNLLEISYEMVMLTLLFWTHADRLRGLQSDYEWLVCLDRPCAHLEGL